MIKRPAEAFYFQEQNTIFFSFPDMSPLRHNAALCHLCSILFYSVQIMQIDMHSIFGIVLTTFNFFFSILVKLPNVVLHRALASGKDLVCKPFDQADNCVATIVKLAEEEQTL